MQRVSEDPEAFCKIMDRSAVGDKLEVNGDLSHYFYRNIQKGKDFDRIMGRMNHTHQRLARPFGDLSVECSDPAANWEAGGETWQAFRYTRKGLRGGLSSRVIAGESGPMHGCKDPLTLDASLVPLYRHMAKVADAEAAGTPMQEQKDPSEYNPFTA